MNHDEFAFFNQQLAGMLRSGIPLEGALAQLSRTMRKGKLREEIKLLEDDLRDGLPLDQALLKRNLPAPYVQMLRAGAQGQSLPSVLTLVADYYTRLHAMSTRLKGLMVYPALILVSSLLLSIFLSFVYLTAIAEISAQSGAGLPRLSAGAGPGILIFWFPSLLLFLGVVAFVVAISSTKLRNWLRWHFPGVKDGSLAQSAATMAALLSSGTKLDTALQLLAETEGNSPAAGDLARWRNNVAEGRARFPEMAEPSRTYPPLFIWLVAQCGEDLARGFQRAADIYSERARHRTDLLLFAALPLAVVVLGMMIIGQTFSVAGLLGRLLGDLGGL